MTPSGQLLNRLPNVSSLILLPYTFVYFYLKKTVLLGSNVTFPDKFKKKNIYLHLLLFILDKVCRMLMWLSVIYN